MKITEHDKKVSIAVFAQHHTEEKVVMVKRAFVESLQGEKKA